jgi:hypothetical protein
MKMNAGTGMAQSVYQRTGRQGLDSREEQLIFNPSPPRDSLSWTKQLRLEVNNLSLSSTEDKSGEAVPPLPHTST